MSVLDALGVLVILALNTTYVVSLSVNKKCASEMYAVVIEQAHSCFSVAVTSVRVVSTFSAVFAN